MEAAIALSRAGTSLEAGKDIASQINGTLSGPADALIVFASPQYDHEALLATLDEASRPALMVGASSAGEFAGHDLGEGMVSVLALRGPEMRFAASVGRDVRDNPAAAARTIVQGFRAGSTPGLHRAALVMTDALAGYASELLSELTVATGGRYEFFGGGAGDNAQFRRTLVFHGTDVLSNAAVALEMQSDKPFGIGVAHGWQPTGEEYRVTEADGFRLIGLNGFPAVEAFEERAAQLGRPFDRDAPIPFFLHNVLGVDSATGYRLRVPLAVDAAGAVTCAAEIPVGARVRIMSSSVQSTVAAAERAAQAALARLGPHAPLACLFFDCVATRLRLGREFANEVDAVRAQLPGIELVGCNTHGQIVRAEGQFDGFHNCTAVVCVLPG